jgi:uncharacterized damage-inducible protein DinB
MADAIHMDTEAAHSIGISFAALLRYNESEAMRWYAWLETQPHDLLDIPFGDAAKRMGNVREMMWHTFITEWVYACVLNGEPYGGWDDFKRDSVTELFAIGDQARAGLRRYLADATEAEMASSRTLSAAGITISGSARKFLTHAFIHSIRHWAQLATVLRQHGYTLEWPHDFVLSDVID